ncbi:MAG: MBL fold metallo-hydrolase [Tissierellia bacterium]|nr:MBL fold metallo-hydrolase [Tissierellia bacterium]
MKVTFVRHSCYTVELKNHFLIFDYIGGPLNIPKGKKIIWVVTHGHKDHYNKDIFTFHGEIQYVISNDIVDDLSKYQVTWVEPDGVYSLDDVLIKTYGSTDEGISIYLQVEGKGIYHSGDLNYWIWPRYSQKDIEQMEIDFTKEVNKVKDEIIDIAMIIVDPRLKDDYSLAGSYYLKTLNAKYFFPLHMWGEFSLSKRFKKEFQGLYPDKKIMEIKKEGQTFSLPL